MDIYFKHCTKWCFKIYFYVMRNNWNMKINIPNCESYVIKKPNNYKKSKKYFKCFTFKSYDFIGNQILLGFENKTYEEIISYFVKFFDSIFDIVITKYDAEWIGYDTRYCIKTNSVKFDTCDIPVKLQNDEYIELYQPDCVIENKKQLGKINRHQFTKTIYLSGRLSCMDIEQYDFPLLEKIICNVYSNYNLQLMKYNKVTHLELVFWILLGNVSLITNCLQAKNDLTYLKIDSQYLPIDHVKEILLFVQDHPNLKTFVLKGGTLWTSADFMNELCDLINKNKTITSITINIKYSFPHTCSPDLIESILNNTTLQELNIYSDNSYVNISFGDIIKIIERGINFTVYFKITYLNYDKYRFIIHDIIKTHGYDNGTILSLIKSFHIINFPFFVNNYHKYRKLLSQRAKRFD